MRVFALLALCFVAVTAIPSNPQRIAGGSEVPNLPITQYPSIVSLLYTSNWSVYVRTYAGTLINNRSIITAAHCVQNDEAIRWRIRAGSNGNSGGVIANVNNIIVHASYNPQTLDNDLAILRAPTAFTFNQNVRPAPIAGPNYVVPENDVVWAAGWGDTYYGSNAGSAQLRHVALVLINPDACSYNYASQGITITNNMMCAGWPTGGRGQCRGDDGGPLYHNGVVIGVFSFGIGCGLADFPGVNVRVNRYTSWISVNA